MSGLGEWFARLVYPPVYRTYERKLDDQIRQIDAVGAAIERDDQRVTTLTSSAFEQLAAPRCKTNGKTR